MTMQISSIPVPRKILHQGKRVERQARKERKYLEGYSRIGVCGIIRFCRVDGRYGSSDWMLLIQQRRSSALWSRLFHLHVRTWLSCLLPYPVRVIVSWFEGRVRRQGRPGHHCIQGTSARRPRGGRRGRGSPSWPSSPRRSVETTTETARLWYSTVTKIRCKAMHYALRTTSAL